MAALGLESLLLTKLELTTVGGALPSTNSDAGLPSATVAFASASSLPTLVMLVLKTVSGPLSSSLDGV